MNNHADPLFRAARLRLTGLGGGPLAQAPWVEAYARFPEPVAADDGMGN